MSLAEWYEQAVVESGIRPIDDPDLALDDVPEKGELRFRAVVPTVPRPELGAVTGLEVAKDEPEIPEGALEAELERLRMRGFLMAPVDRPAAEGDFWSSTSMASSTGSAWPLPAPATMWSSSAPSAAGGLRREAAREPRR